VLAHILYRKENVEKAAKKADKEKAAEERRQVCVIWFGSVLLVR
jgi:hypothetical protein